MLGTEAILYHYKACCFLGSWLRLHPFALLAPFEFLQFFSEDWLFSLQHSARDKPEVELEVLDGFSKVRYNFINYNDVCL